MYGFSQSRSRPGGVQNLRMCTLAKAPLRVKFASPQRGVATFLRVETPSAPVPVIRDVVPLFL